MQKICRKMLVILMAAMLMTIGFSNTTKAANTKYETESGKGAKSNNMHNHSYNDTEWSHPITSYLYSNEDGTYDRVERIGKYIYAEKYSSDLLYQSGKKIALELPLFGGIYRSSDAYFVVEGKENSNSKKGVPEFRILKYDKAWRKLASVDITDANTSEPFAAGCCRFAEDNGYLYIHTCHEMYNGHQAKVLIKLQMADCKVITADTDVANIGHGYVSHSFNQFAAVKDGVLYTCDHGEGYPNGIVIVRFDKLAEGTEYFENVVTSVTAMDFTVRGWHPNYTGAELGGFELTDTHAIVAGTSVVQNNSKNSTKDNSNIFITTIGLDNFNKSSVSQKWITNYTKKSKRTAGNPYMIKTDNNRYILIWEEYIGHDYDRTCYTFIDGVGNVLSDKKVIYCPLSDCEPVVAGGSLIWYVTGKDYETSTPSFYRCPIDGSTISPEPVKTKFTKDGITYKITKCTGAGGNVTIIGNKLTKKQTMVILPKAVLYNGCKYNVTAIGAKAFRNAPKLQYVEIPQNVTVIGEKAFQNAKKLQYVLIPKTVKSIGTQAFQKCSSLNYLYIYSTKLTNKNIGKNAFKGVPQRINVYVPAKKQKAYAKLLKKKGLPAGVRCLKMK